MNLSESDKEKLNEYFVEIARSQQAIKILAIGMEQYITDISKGYEYIQLKMSQAKKIVEDS